MTKPIDPEYVEVMNVLAATIDRMFNEKGKPRKVAFALLTANVGATDGGRVNYIGNASRNDMVVLMKEYIARHEGRVTTTETKQ
jgi:hypothetical protein